MAMSSVHSRGMRRSAVQSQARRTRHEAARLWDPKVSGMGKIKRVSTDISPRELREPHALPAPSFAALLRRFRRASGLTQEELAERASISTRTLSDLERELVQRPQRETLRLL